MDSLLAPAVLRRLKLVEYLDSVNSWITSAACVVTLNCSLKTLNSDIKYINEIWKDYLEIEMSKNLGIRLIFKTSNAIYSVYQAVYQDSFIFRFLEELLFKPDRNAEYWINELYVSSATFYRSIHQLESILAQRDIQLHRNPFYLFSDNENSVRIFYLNYFIEAYNYNWPFTLSQSSIRRFIGKVDFRIQTDLNEQLIFNYSLSFVIALYRMNFGFLLSAEIHNCPDDKVEKIIMKLEPLYRDIISKCGLLPLPFWHKEITRTIFYFFYGWQDFAHVKRVYRKINYFLDQLASDINYAMDHQVKKIIAKKLLYWYGECLCYPFSRTLLINKKVRLAKDVQRSLPVFSTIVFIRLAELDSQHQSFRLTEEFYCKVLLLLIEEWRYLLAHLKHFRPPIKVLIVSDYNTNHANMLADSLHFNQELLDISLTYKKAFLAEQVRTNIFLDYDLIICNSAIANFQAENVVLVNDFLTLKDREIISQRMIACHKNQVKKKIQELQKQYQVLPSFYFDLGLANKYGD